MIVADSQQRQLTGPRALLVAALSQLAGTVQRARTVDDVLATAARGILRLDMRLGAFQMCDDRIVLRHLATAPARLALIEASIGRSVHGLSAPLEDWDLVRSVVEGRRIVFRHDLDVFDRFLRLSIGYDASPLDESPDTAGVTAGVLAPLFVRDAAWGLLIVYSKEFTRADADAVALFATHVGSAIEVAESLEALASAQQELVKRERLAALGELAAVVAHEVRNPLGVLFNSIGSLRAIVDAGAPAERLADASTLLSIAGEEAERLKRIVSDLLDFARPYEPALREYAISDLAAEVVAETSHDARVVIAVPPALPLVSIDPRHMRQALLNLVLNGLQALPADGFVTISARVESHTGGAGVVRIDVRDDGTGIPSNVRPTIFEPFFTTKASGTGLGLAIVKRIVDAHRGDLEVESSASGSTFSILLAV